MPLVVVRFWHESEVPVLPAHVSYRGKTGQHMLTASFSHFDHSGHWPKVFLEMVAKLAGIYRRRITAASSQEIARYISEDTMARMVIPVVTMFILKICAPYWMR